MIDRYRIYIAQAISPIIGLMALFTIWLRPNTLCTTNQECFSMLPVSVILIVTYLLYAWMFITGVTRKARELYSEAGLPFWKLAMASANYAVLATIFMTSVVLFSRWPGTANTWMDAVFALILPLVSVFALYTSWYFIVGRRNKQIRLDAQKDRTLVA